MATCVIKSSCFAPHLGARIELHNQPPSQHDIHKAMPQEARGEELPSELTQEDEVGSIQLKDSNAFYSNAFYNHRIS